MRLQIGGCAISFGRCNALAYRVVNMRYIYFFKRWLRSIIWRYMTSYIVIATMAVVPRAS
jgi:hypothetical protein